MAWYRVYCLNNVNRISAAEWIEAENDAQALDMVSAKKLNVSCEVWEGRRLVGNVAAQVPA